MDNKRLIIAVVLSIAIWIGWYLIMPKDKLEQKKTPVPTETVVEKKAEQPREISSQGTPSQITISTPISNAKESTISMESEKYRVTLSNRGAVIKDLTYKERDIDLVVKKSQFNTKGVLDFSMHFDDREFMNGNALDSATWKQKGIQDNSVTYYTTLAINGSPVQIEKKYTFPQKGYSLRLEYKLKNLSRKEISFQDGTVIFSPSDIIGPSIDFSNTYNKINGVYSMANDFDQINKGSGFFSKSGILKKEAGNVDWFGIMSRYFLIIMVPENFKGTGVVLDNREKTGFRTGMYMKLNKIEAGKEITKSFKVYIGEKNKKKLGSVDKTIIDAADISKWIEPIRYFVLWCLVNLNSFIGNMGWSLVIFSLLTKLVFMPLTIKSTESMKRMQQLTPKMNELKAKYKDKPDVMQKEMMKMYKENKVNPMGGCFPLLLQMPFFFALYSALINSIDLWNAPFIFWIQDLSMPDTIAQISGFNLNILPILMTITSFLQQKLTTVDTGNQQQKMMTMMMPVIFIFIFWNMPSGLVLYWALQNIFQVMHQLYTNRRAKAKAS